MYMHILIIEAFARDSINCIFLTKIFAQRHTFLCIQHYDDLLQGHKLTKIFVKKLLRLEIEETL